MAQKIIKSDKVSLSSGETNDNVLGNDVTQNVPNDAQAYKVDFLATASATDVKHELRADSDTPVQKSVVSGQDRVPIVPDDRVDQFLVAPGTRLYLEAENTDGSTGNNYFYTIRLIPVNPNR